MPHKKSAFLAVALFLTCFRLSAPPIYASDNTCTCYEAYAYLYYTDPTYGPWIFVNELPYSDSFQVPPGGSGALYCETQCGTEGDQLGQYLCGLYSYPGQHYTFESWWTFEDDDNDSGGSNQGQYSRLNDMLVCP